MAQLYRNSNFKFRATMYKADAYRVISVLVVIFFLFLNFAALQQTFFKQTKKLYNSHVTAKLRNSTPDSSQTKLTRFLLIQFRIFTLNKILRSLL